MDQRNVAMGLASLGRGPDAALVHMSPSEIKALQQLAEQHGGTLTINPNTGLPEAGFLSSILPMVIGASLAPVTGGTSLAFLSNPWVAGGLSGLGAFIASKGDLGQALKWGTGVGGGASLMKGFMGAGAGATPAQLQAATPAARAAATQAMATATAKLTPQVASKAMTQATMDQLVNQAGHAALVQHPTFVGATGFGRIGANLQQAGRGIKSIAGVGRNVADLSSPLYNPRIAGSGSGVAGGGGFSALRSGTTAGSITPGLSAMPSGGFQAAPTLAAPTGFKAFAPQAAGTMFGGGKGLGIMGTAAAMPLLTQQPDPLEEVEVGGEEHPYPMYAPYDRQVAQGPYDYMDTAERDYFSDPVLRPYEPTDYYSPFAAAQGGIVSLKGGGVLDPTHMEQVRGQYAPTPAPRAAVIPAQRPIAGFDNGGSVGEQSYFTNISGQDTDSGGLTNTANTNPYMSGFGLWSPHPLYPNLPTPGYRVSPGSSNTGTFSARTAADLGVNTGTGTTGTTGAAGTVANTGTTGTTGTTDSSEQNYFADRSLDTSGGGYPPGIITTADRATYDAIVQAGSPEAQARAAEIKATIPGALAAQNAAAAQAQQDAIDNPIGTNWQTRGPNTNPLNVLPANTMFSGYFNATPPPLTSAQYHANPAAGAGGGIVSLQTGGLTAGVGDGMSDQIRTTIEGRQPAALSAGEFVVPADVVSGIGNGDTNSGAKRLYAMMNNIRGARTGQTTQPQRITPRLPA